MLRQLLSLAAAAAILTGSVAAHALTLTNRDSTGHSLMIAEDDVERTVTIQPDETLNDLCPEGCTITLGESDSMDFDGTETVMIEGGSLTTAE